MLIFSGITDDSVQQHWVFNFIKVIKDFCMWLEYKIFLIRKNVYGHPSYS